MLEFWKNEWKLFLEDIDSLKNTFAKIFGRKKDYLMLKSGTQEDGEVLPQEEPAQTSSISLENVSSEVSLDSANGLMLGEFLHKIMVCFLSCLKLQIILKLNSLLIN